MKQVWKRVPVTSTTDDEFSKTTDMTSPKRTKKLRTERDLTYTRERTRRKSSNIKTPPTNPIF